MVWKWIEPGDYSRKAVNRAGDIIVERIKPKNAEEEEGAIKTFINWRESHAYPMHVIMGTLKKISKSICPESICVQRLKRRKSLIYKLIRFPKMKLSRIQDIAGCRIITPNVQKARDVAKEYISKNKRHKRVKQRENNYVNMPKEDGYRSIHLVYEYQTINKGKKIFNGRLVEIQIRSQLQHIWATALETVDLFTFQLLKLGKGQASWKYFFRLVSSAFAMEEKCPLVPGTPVEKEELYREIKRMAKELNVFEKLMAFTASVEHFHTKKGSLYVLLLDMKKRKIDYIPFKNDRDGWDKSYEEYLNQEKKYRDNKDFDVVLVGADNMHDLKYGYKNYFADTAKFLEKIKEIIESVD